MSNIITILKELFDNIQLTWAIARYNNRSSFQGHKFGVVWEFLNPLIQIALWGFVFGVLRGRGTVNVNGNSIPFLPWMLVGMTIWLFMNRAVIGGASSVKKRIKLVSKMQLPSSIIPAISIASKLTSYLILLLFVFVVLFVFGFAPTIYWLGFFYYFIAMLIFIYFFSLLNSTIAMVFPDYLNLLKPIMRLFFFFSGAIWRLQEMVQQNSLPAWFVRLMDLTPFSYIINGLRNAFLGNVFFHEDWIMTSAAFWLIVLLISIIGTHLHLKLRAKFIDLA